MSDYRDGLLQFATQTLDIATELVTANEEFNGPIRTAESRMTLAELHTAIEKERDR